MDSERFATILGFVIAVAVLAAACVYVPPGSATKLAVQAAACAPTQVAQPAPVAPSTTSATPKGPVIREVPQQ